MARSMDSLSCAEHCQGVEASAPNSWAVRDQASVWHPFTQALIAKKPIPIIKGKGALLYSETGKEYIDAISSWWVNLHGHSHPYIVEAISRQAAELEHVLFAGHTHPQAIIFAERLLSLFSNAYSHVFYSDNGSTSVEVAIKMAFQMRGAKTKLLSFTGAYHGDTFGAMAAAGKSHYTEPFWPYLFQVESIIPPSPGDEERSWQEFEQAIGSGDIGAFIFEPLIQGAGGMRLHSGEILSKMVQVCQSLGITTIADEVMTGFGRTGPLFASTTLASLPDLICLSKGITGGFLPMGATLVKRPVYESFLSLDPAKAFLHGHSYTANPLCCAAANASLDLLLQNKCSLARKRIESMHRSFQKEYQHHKKLTRCDVLGTILVLEYNRENNSYHDPFKEELSSLFEAEGILIRPLGNVLYLLPPYCISSDQLKKIYSTIISTISTLEK